MNNKSDFHYVYILKSINHQYYYYTGLTSNLNQRLNEHNRSICNFSNKYRPWEIDTAIAFKSRDKASAFEKYLKSHSGRAFAKKHF